MTEDDGWLKQVIEIIGEAVVAVDMHGVIVTTNREARRILGVAAGERTSAIPRLRSASGDPLADEEQPVARALRGEVIELGDFVLREGARHLEIEVRVSPLCAGDGTQMGVLASFCDVTEKRAAEALLVRDAERLFVLSAELDDARRAAERSNQYKSRFLAGMSHELRTPLNAVIGFSELLEQEVFGPLNTKQREYVVNVLSSGRHLLSIVNDILDLSKVEAGRFEIVREFTPIHAIVESALSVVESLRVKHGIQVVRDLPDDLPELYVDPVRIKQVLYNLLSNAVKFSPRDSRVTVRARTTDGVFEISVEDRGCGIRPEDSSRLFREFEQLAPAPRGQAGTGLGLALSKKLVELHSGRIGVESEAGQGSRFWVRLPVLARSSGPSGLTHSAEPHVLIVQEDSIFSQFFQQQLRTLDLASLVARNATDALDQISEHPPKAIAIDVDAQSIDGRGLIELLRNDSRTRCIPLIAVSDSGNLRLSAYLGDLATLVRPFTSVELAMALARAGVVAAPTGIGTAATCPSIQP